MPIYDGPAAFDVFRSDDEDGDDDVSLIEDLDDEVLQTLAEEVYALLKQELRLENERRGWHQLW